MNMDFSYGESFTEDSPEAYERLILDVLLGEPSLFPVNEEVELSWKILDPALEQLGLARQARAVRVGTLGPGFGVRDAAPDRPGLAAAMTSACARSRRTMIVDLPRHHHQEVNKKIVDCARRAAPSPSAGC